jgi:hypothetical protein
MPFTRQIIDYAAEDDGTKMREALYNDIANRVNAHMDSYKQEIAKNLIAPAEQEEVSAEE